MQENQKNTETSKQNQQTDLTGTDNQRQGNSPDKPLIGYAEKQPKDVEKERQGREHQHDYKTPTADNNNDSDNPSLNKNNSQNDNGSNDSNQDSKIGFKQQS